MDAVLSARGEGSEHTACPILTSCLEKQFSLIFQFNQGRFYVQAKIQVCEGILKIGTRIGSVA